MTSSSSTTHNLFDRPELLDSQTRLILSADIKPKRLNCSAARSAGIPGIRERSDSITSTSAIQEIDNDILDGNTEINNDDYYLTRQISITQNDINYDTDIEQEQESTKDYTCKGLYLDQCRRHGVIPSTHFLRHVNNETLSIRYCGLKPINIKVMVPSLKMNTTITKLDLRENGLGSRGAVYISQLIKDNEYIIELNFSNNDIGLQEYCFIDKVKLLKCQTNVCSGKYSSYHKNYLFECHENSQSLVEVHITTHMNVIEENLLNKNQNEKHILEDKIIRYTCMFNKCNDQYLTDKLINIVEEYFQLSFMREAFLNYSFINKQESIYFDYSNLSYQTTSKTDKRENSPSISNINDYLFNNLSNNKSHLSIFIILTLLYLYIIDHLFKQI